MLAVINIYPSPSHQVYFLFQLARFAFTQGAVFFVFVQLSSCIRSGFFHCYVEFLLHLKLLLSILGSLSLLSGAVASLSRSLGDNAWSIGRISNGHTFNVASGRVVYIKILYISTGLRHDAS